VTPINAPPSLDEVTNTPDVKPIDVPPSGDIQISDDNSIVFCSNWMTAMMMILIPTYTVFSSLPSGLLLLSPRLLISLQVLSHSSQSFCHLELLTPLALLFLKNTILLHQRLGLA
jgi:hypothetical protein